MVFPDITNSNSPPRNDTDDISVFLRQLIQRSSTYSSSSSSTSTPMRPHAQDHNLPYPSLFSSSALLHLNSTPAAIFSGSDRLFSDRISRDPGLPSPSSYFPLAGGGSNIPSDSLTRSGRPKSFDNLNECTEDCDYESEEGAEIMGAGEAEMKQHSSRNQSKRTRAAEVHNLSEKRRRSRINEKMKALQNLIPNSNKTDKASMLDEAIEYLKQLQLQVQMLSMRNGLNLHTMCLPGEQAIPHATQLPHMRIHNLNNSSGSFDITKALNQVADVSDTVFNFENLCTSSSRPSLPIASTVINSETTTFGLESCIPPKQHFHVQNSSQAICRDQNLPHEQLLGSRTQMKPSATAMPLWFDTGESNVEGHNSLEDRTHMKYGSQGMFVDNSSGQNQRISSNFSGLYAASATAQNDKLAISR